MSLSKKERNVVIWIGIAIGVACSSMLVRYALKQKELKTAQRMGAYNLGLTAYDQSKFAELPQKVRDDLPNGIVVFHESEPLSDPKVGTIKNSWIIETSGSFRSERLFILIENIKGTKEITYYRASEIKVRINPEKSLQQLEYYLDDEKYKIIGRNKNTGEFIIQIKDIRPSAITQTLETFKNNKSLFSTAQISSWRP